MSPAEACSVPGATRRQCTVTHQPTEEDLPLEVAEVFSGCLHHAIAFDQLASRPPAAWSRNHVVVSCRELRSTVATATLDCELQEAFCGAVVEPVRDRLGDEFTLLEVVREHFDRQFLVDDLADLLLSAIGKRNPRAITHASEHHADFFAELVDEDRDRVGLVQVAGQLAQGLAHQAGLETDMRVAHLTFDFGAWRQGRHRVDHDHVDRTGADQHVANLERLLTCIGLRDQQLVDVDTNRLGVDRVHGVLGIDVGAHAAVALRFSHDVHRQGRLTG